MLKGRLHDEDPLEDPDYEPSTVETESEEYCSHNNTESDIDLEILCTRMALGPKLIFLVFLQW